MIASGASEQKYEMQSLCEKHNIVWNMTAIRIKDPEVSLPFYRKHFHMRVIRKVPLDFLKPPRCNYILETSISEEEAKKQSWEDK